MTEPGSASFKLSDYLNRGRDRKITEWGQLNDSFDVAQKINEIRAFNRAIRGENQNEINKVLATSGLSLKKVQKNPYAGYRAKETEDLMNLIGRKNMGVKFNPTFNSSQAAREFIEDRINKAKESGDEKAAEYWSRYGVRELDLDRNPDTINNVVVYSNEDAGRIKAIDGFQIVPRTKKEALRARYTAFPDKTERAAAMKSQEKSLLKAYFRKHPNPDTWERYPFEDFAEEHEKDKPAFKLIEEEVKSYMDDVGLTAYSGLRNPTGVLAMTHYQAILKRLASVATNAAVMAFFDIPTEYDLREDPYRYKNKSNMKLVKAWLLESHKDHLPKIRTYVGDKISFEPDNTVLESFVQGLCIVMLLWANAGQGSSYAEKFMDDINKKARKTLITWKKVASTSDSICEYQTVVDATAEAQKAKAAATLQMWQAGGPKYVEPASYGKEKIPVSKAFGGFAKPKRATLEPYTRMSIPTPGKYNKAGMEKEEEGGGGITRFQTVRKTPRKRGGTYTTPIKEMEGGGGRGGRGGRRGGGRRGGGTGRGGGSGSFLSTPSGGGGGEEEYEDEEEVEVDLSKLTGGPSSSSSSSSSDY
jgi:uncharacterized membrane protein YgcG